MASKIQLLRSTLNPIILEDLMICNLKQQKYIQTQFLYFMRRPQSAKPGHRGNWGQISESDLQDQQGASRGAYRKNVKLMKPDLTTNDFARILPKKIYQDKERLYSQALQLKQNLNQTIEQNIRLKTRITILQKQKDKLTRHIENNRQPQNAKQANSRVNIYPGKSGEKENMMIRNLKKLVREGKEQNEFLKQQNAKIKKAIKYTKINQLEIQRKMLQDQNRRVVGLLEQLNGQLANQDHAERQLHVLRRELEDQQEANRQLNDVNLHCRQNIRDLEEKLSQQTEKAQAKQNKLQRELALTKRKLNQTTKYIQDLKRQLNTLKTQTANTKSQVGAMKPQSTLSKAQSQRPKLARPVSSNPYKSQQQAIGGLRLNTESKKQQQDNKQNQKMKNIQIQNQQLKQELSRTKIRLEQSEREVKRQSEEKSQPQRSEPQKSQPMRSEQQQGKIVAKPMAEATNSNNNANIQQQPQKPPSAKKIQNKEDEQYYDEDNENEQQQDNYENEFEPSQLDQSSNASPQKSKPKQTKQLDQYKKDFEEEEEQQPLYVKEDSPEKKKKKPAEENKKKTQGSKKQIEKQKDKKKKDKKQAAGAYKPDKNTLKQIKELLTYRMKAQRYPYDELKRDIEQAKQKQFAVNDLKGMFINEPFYLTPGYADSLIQYCFENYTPSQTQTVNSDVLLTKLRKVIDQFELIDEKQQEDMLLRIAEMVTEYPEELETAFQKIKNGQETVAKGDLIEMFQNLQLEQKYIELIIQELSLCSTDTNHLNFVGFFQRFYVENMSALQNNGQIDQQQMQSSSEQVSRNLKSRDTKKLNQVKAQFQDNDDELMVDEGEKISLGNEDHQYNEGNIVSDDEPI